MKNFSQKNFEQALSHVRQQLLDFRTDDGHWEGNLSNSALSTATAVLALATVSKTCYQPYIQRGVAWLAQNQNEDGGWGDTVRSNSNISTTALCWAAFAAFATSS